MVLSFFARLGGPAYDIFLNLEAADSQDLFRSGLSSPRYGLVPEAASPDNPDALPIGISKTVVATPIKGWPAGDYAGLTCAACHEGQLTYNVCTENPKTTSKYGAHRFHDRWMEHAR
jgi:hypothetical protein